MADSGGKPAGSLVEPMAGSALLFKKAKALACSACSLCTPKAACSSSKTREFTSASGSLAGSMVGSAGASSASSKGMCPLSLDPPSEIGVAVVMGDCLVHCFLHQGQGLGLHWEHLQQVLLVHLPQMHQVQPYHSGYQGLGKQANYLVSLWEVMGYRHHY